MAVRTPQHVPALIAMAALAAAPGAAAASVAEPAMRLAGRLHPVIVHFPIALLIIGAVLELARLARGKRPAADSALVCVVLGAIGAAAAAGAGWLNADLESHPAALATTLTTHRWLGVSTACLAALTLLLALAARSSPRAAAPYRLAIVACAALVGVTGHFGGTMVHGEGYLWAALGEGGARTGTPGGAEAPLPARPPPAGVTITVDFGRDIRPIIEARCLECHSAAKHKGDLRLDDPGHLFEGDEGLWVIVPGDPGASEIMSRLELDAREKGHMPPKGDRVPREQIELVRRWIAEGAYWTTPGGRADGAVSGPVSRPGDAPPKVERAAPGAGAAAPSDSISTGAAASALRALRAAGARVEPVFQGSEELDANLSLAGAAVGDGELAHLDPLSGVIVSLDLSGTSVSDAGVSRLLSTGGWARLRRLNLTDVPVSDACLASVAALPALESVNFVGTKVSDVGLTALRRAASLRRVYVWRTGVTGEGAAALRAARSDIEVVMDSPGLGPPDAAPAKPK